ncbi:MAG TPA: hypothetical protein VK166_05615 [Chitinophagaceae bacterium]|nr:hypothetical protein [Chitinophagaceae bacterium]
MKRSIIFITAGILSLAGRRQTVQDKEAVKKVVTAFQEDFNDGSSNTASRKN